MKFPVPLTLKQQQMHIEFTAVKLGDSLDLALCSLESAFLLEQAQIRFQNARVSNGMNWWSRCRTGNSIAVSLAVE